MGISSGGGGGGGAGLSATREQAGSERPGTSKDRSKAAESCRGIIDQGAEQYIR